MKKNYLFILCSLFVITLYSQEYKLDFINHIGGASSVIANEITVDNNQNIYTIGYFFGTVDFDPSSTVQNLSSNGGGDIFIQKLDSNGNLLWVKIIGGSGTDEGNYITTDSDGNIYATGTFRNTVDFNPGADVFNLTSNGLTDIFVLKLDTNGNFLWAKGYGDDNFDNGLTLTIDSNNNVITSGFFQGTVNFNPDTTSEIITSNGSTDIFILKLDSTGNFNFVKKIGGTSTEAIRTITTDKDNNIFGGGYFGQTVDFDPGPNEQNFTVLNGVIDRFLMKMDKDGNLVWAHHLTGKNDEGIKSITIDKNNDLCVTGHINGETDLDYGSAQALFTSVGSGDVFVQKLDNDGNFIWAKTMGGSEFDYSNKIITDSEANILTVGYFQNTADFNPNAGIENLISGGNEDIFIQKLDTDGNFVWSYGAGGTGEDIGSSITIDSNKNIYVCGEFRNTVDFDFTSDIQELTSLGSQDAFVKKLTLNTLSTNDYNSIRTLNVFPNPTTDKLTIEFSTTPEDAIEIYNILGQLVIKLVPAKKQQIDVSNLTSGLYFIKLENDNTAQFKFLKK